MSAWLHSGVVGLALVVVGCGDGETPPTVETCPDSRLPFGAEEDTAPQPLLAGVSYEVRVQRAGPTQSGTGLVGGGAVTFTR